MLAQELGIFLLSHLHSLGQGLATFEAICVLTMIVREWDFEVVSNMKGTLYSDSLTLPMKDAFNVRIKKHTN